MTRELRINAATFETVLQEVVRAVNNSSDSGNASSNVSIAFEKSGLVEAKEAAEPLQKASEVNLTINIINYYSREVTMSTFNNQNSQIGAQGEFARAEGNSFNTLLKTDSVNLATLAGELEKVRLEMKKVGSNEPEHDEAIGIVAAAEKAAKAGDANTALTTLKGAGTWVLDVAKSVTASLVKDAIEGKFGP